MPKFPRLALSRFLLALGLAVAFILVAPGSAAAGSLEDAKAAGLVGERPDGYLGVVPSEAPLDIVQLVEEINAKRRDAYAEIAAKNGTSVEAVAVLTADKLYQKASPGDYLMNENGQWVRK